MSISIPRVMNTFFFNIFKRNGAINTFNARKTLEFIAHVYPELANEIEDNMSTNKLSSRLIINNLLQRFFENHTTWGVQDIALYEYGYKVTLGQTIVSTSDDDELVEVFELGGSSLDPVTHIRRSTNVLEYFDKMNICELLQAIECRVCIPASMYTGLDNMGNNLEE